MNELQQQLEESRNESKELKLKAKKLERELIKKTHSCQDSSELENEIWNTYGDSSHRRSVRSTSEGDLMHNIEIINSIIRDDKSLWKMAGHDTEGFKEILDSFRRKILDLEKVPLFRDIEDRKHDAGNRYKMYPSHALFITLVYLKHNVAQEALAGLAGVSQPTISRYVQLSCLILRKILPVPSWITRRLKEIKTVEDFKKAAPGKNGGEILADGSHVPVQRPADDTKQKEMYSGKKKNHTRNTLFITNKNAIILYTGKARPGKTHDITAIREDLSDLGRWADSMKNEETVPEERIEILCDLGYQGLDKDLPGADVITPFKKPKGGKLTAQQKEFNKKLSRRRIVVEHAIGGAKQYKIMRGPYLGTNEEFERDMDVVCGLANLRRMKHDGTYDEWMQWLKEPPPT